MNIKASGVYIDATFGRGGHSKAILDCLGKNGKLIVMDRDPQAIAVANELRESDSRLQAVHAPFSQIREIKETVRLDNSVDGILFDLGVSSPQLDDAKRGFSFLRDGPLDMRMNPLIGISAAEWINNAEESEIANTFYKFGDEKYSRRMAKRIIAKNGYSDRIEVINKKSTELNVGKDLDKKADLIISEILSSEFVGEGVQPSLLDANQRLLQDNGRMIPEAGEIKIALLESSPEIEKELFVFLSLNITII